MSQRSPSPVNDEIWEFVTCARCHMPFSPDPSGSAPPPVPFWLTECGHVVCNNHLNADQSCAQCNAQQIQMVPLQRQMEAPMSDWFRSLPHAMDTIANAAKFQQEMLSSLARYYKGKYLQTRALIDRVKGDLAEVKTLRKTVEQLRSENEQLRQYAEGSNGKPSSHINSNGKRRMTDAYMNGVDSRSYSSPRSAATPLGPNRLTLPADHQPPVFAQRSSHAGSNGPEGSNAPRERPGSSRFVQ
ncbi:hypothetical protein BV25DRAFT_1800391 [Artomyces pyxidatus]|uniref:Uncharacterized protein n=1 Tax=Artomyces pyxidatus TaxID=48021 RepID=A0ACB8T722_9AGAM|nr:hypothetical protein BV25DRAFT_1800391 [Artomyces pyxidatus]